jgi:hypothetical protein
LPRLKTLQINDNCDNLSQTYASEAGGVRLAGEPLHADLSVPPGATTLIESAGRDIFSRWGDVAASSPLAPGSHDSVLEFRYSHPPDRIPANRVRRLKRCPSSVISYKLMLHLKKLQKSAI